MVLQESATYLVESLPALPLKKNDPNDVDTTADDHGYDALGFILGIARPPVREVLTVPRRDTDQFPRDVRAHPHPEGDTQARPTLDKWAALKALDRERAMAADSAPSARPARGMRGGVRVRTVDGF